MREIVAITKDLTDIGNTLKVTKDAMDKAQETLNKAGIAYTEAQNKAQALQEELRDAMNLLMPGFSNDGRVRQG